MKHWLIGSVAATVLVVACGGSKEPEASDFPQEIAQAGDIKFPGLKLRAGDASEAGDALAALSLSESGAGRVSFADTSASGADATFNDVVFNFPGDDAPMKAGSLAFKGLEMTDAGANFSQMTLSDISLELEDGENQSMNVSSVQLTNPSPELGAWVASLMGEGEPAAFPSLDQLSFDGLSLGGLAIDASNIEELDVFQFGGIDVRSLSATGIGSMVLEGIDIQGTDDDQAISFSLGSVKIAGLNETMMAVLSSSFANGATGGDPEQAIDELMSLISASPGDPGYDSFVLDAFAADVSGVAVNVPSLEALVTRDNQDRATRSVTKPFTMSVKADPEGEIGSQLAGPLALMGYEELNFSGQGDVRMDPDADTLSSDSKDNFLALEDGFKLSYGGSFGGLGDFYKAMAKSAESGANEEEALLGAVSSLALNEIDINLQDNSIVDKAFAVAAAMSGQDSAGLRVQATAGTAMLPILAGQAGVDPALAAELGGALSKFLDGSGTLSIKLAPDAPLTADDFEDPTALTKARLGFSAETK